MKVKIVYLDKENRRVVEETIHADGIDYNYNDISFHWKDSTIIESVSEIQSMEITDE